MLDESGSVVYRRCLVVGFKHDLVMMRRGEEEKGDEGIRIDEIRGYLYRRQSFPPRQRQRKVGS